MLVGLVVTLLPIVIGVVGIFAVLLIVGPSSAGRSRARPVAIVAVVLALMLVPVVVALAAVAIEVPLAWAIRRRIPAGRRPFLEGRLAYGLVLLTVAIGLVPVLLPDEPWLPAERVTMSSEPKPIVGYVLSSTATETVILRRSEHRVLLFGEEAERRQICNPARFFLACRTKP